MRNLTVESAQLRLAELIDKRLFAEALLFSESFSRVDIRGMHISEKSELYYFIARSLFELGEYNKAIIKVKTAMRLIRPTAEHLQYARQKQLLGNVFTRLGRNREALECYVESFAGFKRACSNVDIYGSLVNIGLAHFSGGDLGQALKYFAEARDAARKYNSESKVMLVERNIARALVLTGRFSESHNILLAQRKNSDSSGVSSHYIDQIDSMACTYELQYDDSSNALNRTIAFFRGACMSRDIAICLEYLGLNEYFAGNYAKAREYYDQVLAMPEPTASAVAQTLRMLTDVEIAQNNWEAAKTTAARAETAISKISERIELGALWRANGHIHTHDGNHAEARSCFAKSIDLLRQLGARYELALSHFDAGRSACHSAKERLEHLRQAKALFLEMEVPKRVAQVDKDLTVLEAQASSAPDSKRRSLTIKSTAAKHIPEIIAVSHAMAGIMKTIERIKDRDLTVLITGETGTGKDLLAEYIHYSSVRADKQYCVVNSATLPEHLLEAELFGYTRGAFSGAAKDSEGLIASADGGTFCFDEIGEIPVAMQAKLLRVIDTKIVRRLGSSVDRRVDVRFIALTNRNLEQMIVEGAFRSDLYHRLGQMPIHLPPLRARREDILPLVESLLAKLDLSINDETDTEPGQLSEAIKNYSWPGNVREMIAILTRIAALRDNNGHSDIARLLLRELDSETPEATDRQRLFLALQRHNGNKSKVAEEIGIPRTTLISQLRKLKL